MHLLELYVGFGIWGPWFYLVPLVAAMMFDSVEKLYLWAVLEKFSFPH